MAGGARIHADEPQNNRWKYHRLLQPLLANVRTTGRAAITTGYNMFATETAGELLRTWRRRRRMTQLDVASEAELSASFLRHLEAGRVAADAETLLQIAKCLRLPLRARNAMLAAAGHPPPFPQHGFDTPSMQAARTAVDALLEAHVPHPALAIDRHWQVLAANSAVATLVAGVEPLILRPRFNLLRLFLHPAGLASRTVNLTQCAITC
ncbi:MAG: helix-turn-helix domain-containing protein [Rhodopila sp.]